ncbi:hypothetical protein DVH24_021009 [Malus domestica]|uniref:Uncharacterized protein n=1 Tax=Malus domestica TaxID=3750 RepID=A0A498JA15_MALDO|nr:hypothetical protein DVH24_021009 [Malus domestica]
MDIQISDNQIPPLQDPAIHAIAIQTQLFIIPVSFNFDSVVLHSTHKNLYFASLGFQISHPWRHLSIGVDLCGFRWLCYCRIQILAFFLRMHAKAAQSSFRDQTVVERLNKSFSSRPGQNGPSSGLKSKSNKQRFAVSIQSEFNKKASKISYGIHLTSLKLGKLTKDNYVFIQMYLSCHVVAKRTSMFDDPTRKIQETTIVIKQDIIALNSAVVDL